MASIRRTLSPVPRPGGLGNGEACQVASPLSKSSSNSQNYPPQAGLLSSLLGSLDYALYRIQSFVLGLFSQRASRDVDRFSSWRRVYLHILMCFVVGIFVGLTPFIPLSMSTNSLPKQEAFDFELIGLKNEMSKVGKVSLQENSTWGREKVNVEVSNPRSDLTMLSNSMNQSRDVVFNIDKLLIVITPTYAKPLQAYFLNRLAHTLRLIQHPLLWIVVEMNYQSMETADLLRNSGVMYRHLICSIKNETGITDRSAHLRNVALSHIETHRLDGIAYFADDDRIYSTALFNQMRNISRIGTWTTAMLVQSRDEILIEGPICNSSRVVGWHVDDRKRRSQRFHAEMSGFAFNSTVIWDQKRWHMPIIEPIRQIETVKPDIQASTFIEQLVEDESQMECFSMASSGIMVWHHTTDTYSYPHNWFTSIISPLTDALQL
ncbi:probable beta-1,4-xylosyltransferase IRX9H [Salvia splendens]|uniref:probable beta-1,4-xylosyltransferase IRX9H n=1 Tax=Salvia splendens TaxID=180675 RepID=UPI001C252FA5|nr:probable beta-1,4-xylosyltransferase IRX9H [Salvia splendens]XP_042003038.1 probable beta-1,4-xylosyltransferase IRX9H [Salvia splendens]XP_042003039.1 probable beta-1,4-xylosyltransferase IRX9H [Salvia splendens]XP_042003040.1 probable beta-1,4-xylosyltransferase IRX9H [Salvia splendens]